MLAGGAIALADTRDAGLRRLRTALPRRRTAPHLPAPLSSRFVPGDVTYVSSVEAAEAVAGLGGRGSARRVMLQVETGDLREGVPVEEVCGRGARRRGTIPGSCWQGVATNYACFQGPPEGVRRSVEAIAAVARRSRGGRRGVGGQLERAAAAGGRDRAPPGDDRTPLRRVAAARARMPSRIGRCRGVGRTPVVLRAEVLEGYTKRALERGGSGGWCWASGCSDLGSGAVRFASGRVCTRSGRSSDYLVVGGRRPGNRDRPSASRS